MSVVSAAGAETQTSSVKLVAYLSVTACLPRCLQLLQAGVAVAVPVP